MRLALLGLGLIGGSIARALRHEPGGSFEVVAWSPSGVGPRAALAEGVIREAPGRIEDALDGADLVVLAAPPLECLRSLEALAGPLRSRLSAGAVVTDVASTKATIVARADALRLPFVGGHPMAGRESSGFGASRADLFVGRPWVVVPGSTARMHEVERVERLARSCGASPVRLTASDHDAAAAAISHLPLVVAAGLVEAIVGAADRPDRTDWPLARDLAATGWRDMTRLAHGDPTVAAGIAATNGPAIASRLRDLRAVLDEWLVALEAESGPDAVVLTERFRAARVRLEPHDGA